jgi:hypothetical protein
MNQLKKHKFHLLSLLLIFLLFLFSVHLRKEKLSLPLSPQLEWITAHTLITLEIWDEAGGPQAHNFNPIYTYPGKGNQRISTLGGVMNKNGEMYYTSYPPFSFIFAYYGTKLLGGPDISSLRAFGLMIHFFSALLIYLIIRKLKSSSKDGFSIAGILGAALYLFSAGTLWMHSIMYFSDMSVQLFLLLGIYFLVRLVREDFRKEIPFLIGLGGIIFLGVYTEWIALFFAFFSGIFLLILYFIKKKRLYIKGFIIIAFSSIFSLALTLIQFSNIKDWNELKKVSETKYEERSGSQENLDGMEVWNWENPKSFELMEANFNRNFAMVINLSGIIVFFLIPVLLWKKLRQKLKNPDWKLLILLLLILTVLTHYLLFYNFNAIHNFSNLKTGFLLIFFISIVILIIEESLNWQFKSGLAVVLLFIIAPRCLKEIKRFDNFYSFEKFNHAMIESANTVRMYQSPEKLVFVNTYVSPEFIYRAHHNVFPLDDTTQALSFMDYFEVDKAQFYHHENQYPDYMLELEKSGTKLKVVKRVEF